MSAERLWGDDIVERNVLLNQLKLLKQMRQLEHHRADVVCDRHLFERSLSEHRFNLFLRCYLKRRITICNELVDTYNKRVAELSKMTEDVQKELPVELVTDLLYINAAIDDVATGRTGCIAGLKTLFSLRSEAYRYEKIR